MPSLGPTTLRPLEAQRSDMPAVDRPLCRVELDRSTAVTAAPRRPQLRAVAIGGRRSVFHAAEDAGLGVPVTASVTRLRPGKTASGALPPVMGQGPTLFRDGQFDESGVVIASTWFGDIPSAKRPRSLLCLCALSSCRCSERHRAPRLSTRVQIPSNSPSRTWDQGCSIRDGSVCDCGTSRPPIGRNPGQPPGRPPARTRRRGW